jgi:Tol biopolymer transport system component
MKKHLGYRTISFLCAMLLLSSCQSTWRSLPDDTEIVYDPPIVDHLGFIDANGGNNQIIDVGAKILRPVWSSDGSVLYGLSGRNAGYPAYWDTQNGHYRVCERNMPQFTLIQGSGNPDNPYEVIIQNTWQIQIYDLKNCRLVENLVDYSNSPGDFDMAGFSYLALINKLVYGLVTNPYKNREYSIIILDLNNNHRIQLSEGINPIWSPDGTKVAYIGLDGLYTINSDGTENKQLIIQPMFDPFTSGSPWFLTPIPRWSPDGEWIVYHVCKTDICLNEESEIYKIRVGSGLPERILTGGQDPSWRP